MIIGILPDMTLYADTNIQFKSSLTKLIETSTGIDDSKLIGENDDEATMKWDITKGGNYRLTYYTEAVSENLGDTTRIEMIFQVGEGLNENNQIVDNLNAMVYQIKAYTSDNELIENIQYREHMYGYTGV